MLAPEASRHSIIVTTSKMLRQTLLVTCLQLLVFARSSTLPEITSYAKVSRNGATSSTLVTSNKNFTNVPVNQARSFQESTISRSPIYVPSNTPKLRNGEAFDHTTSKKYTTLDRDAVAKLDAASSWKQAQERFHPPASFEHTIAHSNAVRQQQQQQQPVASETQSASGTKFPVPGYATLPQGVYSASYDYQGNSKPMESGSSSDTDDEYSQDSGDSYSKIPDSYKQPDISSGDQSETPKFPVFQSSSSYKEKYPPQPVDFPDHFDSPTFSDDSYGPHDAGHDYHHDLIFDHPPDHDFHHHHHHHQITTATEEPEMEDQRVNKRPYSYYYIGKKLWYLPLYFSIYFIIYIAALVLKSITRHKINFPATLAAVGNGRQTQNWEGPNWLDLTKRVFDGIDLYNSLQNNL